MKIYFKIFNHDFFYMIPSFAHIHVQVKQI